MKVANWLSVFACPVCRGTLDLEPDSLSCTGCRTQYPLRDNTVHLVPPTEVERLDAMAEEYRKMRLADGWRPMTPVQQQMLPEAGPAGYDSLYWRVRRESLAALKHAVPLRDNHHNVGIAADIGSGTGWLAYRLTTYGYRTIALDASIDEDFGLGGCEIYRKLCDGRLIAVRGDLGYLPFQKGSLHLAVYNASLHYADDIHATLSQARQSLAPTGLLVVMDTPVSRTPRQGRRLGSRHVTRSEVEYALKSAGLSPRWLSVSRGIPWFVHQLRTLVRGKPLFTFPLVIASPAGEHAGRPTSTARWTGERQTYEET
jgi:SAM-dependent methyltransferase/uncharacterized protein YbaR (Trm112 family)